MISKCIYSNNLNLNNQHFLNLIILNFIVLIQCLKCRSLKFLFNKIEISQDQIIYLAAPLSLQEIMYIIKSIQLGKVPNPDGCLIDQSKVFIDLLTWRFIVMLFCTKFFSFPLAIRFVIIISKVGKVILRNMLVTAQFLC